MMTWRIELKCKCCLLLLSLNSRKIVDCNGLCTSSCLFVAETSVLHSYTGIVWKRVEWCSFEAELRMKWRDNEGETRHFAGTCLALAIKCWFWLARECERHWLIEEGVVSWWIVCREWRHWICILLEGRWLVYNDFGGALRADPGWLWSLWRLKWWRIIGGWEWEFGKSTFTMKRRLNMAKLGTFCFRFGSAMGIKLRQVIYWVRGTGWLEMENTKTRQLKFEGALPLWVVRLIRIESEKFFFLNEEIINLNLIYDIRTGYPNCRLCCSWCWRLGARTETILVSFWGWDFGGEWSWLAGWNWDFGESCRHLQKGKLFGDEIA